MFFKRGLLCIFIRHTVLFIFLVFFLFVCLFAGPMLNFTFGSLAIALCLLGIFSLILMCVASVAMCRRRGKSDSHMKNENHDDSLCHGAMLIADDVSISNHHDRRFSEDDPDPDIIPNIRGKRHGWDFWGLNIVNVF